MLDNNKMQPPGQRFTKNKTNPLNRPKFTGTSESSVSKIHFKLNGIPLKKYDMLKEICQNLHQNSTMPLEPLNKRRINFYGDPNRNVLVEKNNRKQKEILNSVKNYY